jgi:integrase
MRQPQPFWKSTHKCWYLKLNRKDVRLDPDEKKAWDLYHKIMGRQLDLTADPRVVPLVDEFLEYAQKHKAPGTYNFYRHYVKSFADTLSPTLKVSGLKAYYLSRWIDGLYPPHDGHQNSRRNGIRAIQRALNWAVKEDLILSNPLAKVSKPAAVARDAYLTTDQFKKLIAAIKHEVVRDYVMVLRLTGCRPQEARIFTAAMLDCKGRCFVVPRDLAKSKREERVILLNKEAFAICRRLAIKHPEGPILRNTRGRPWTAKALYRHCDDLTTKLGFYVSPGVLRHVFVTDALTNGVDPITLSKLVGHRDLNMIQRVYNKLQKRTDHMRKALDQATEGIA